MFVGTVLIDSGSRRAQPTVGSAIPRLKASFMKPWLPEATGSAGLRPIFTTLREARKVIKTNTWVAAVDPGGGICNGLWSVSVYMALSLG